MKTRNIHEFQNGWLGKWLFPKNGDPLNCAMNVFVWRIQAATVLFPTLSSHTVPANLDRWEVCRNPSRTRSVVPPQSTWRMPELIQLAPLSSHDIQLQNTQEQRFVFPKPLCFWLPPTFFFLRINWYQLRTQELTQIFPSSWCAKAKVQKLRPYLYVWCYLIVVTLSSIIFM